MEDTELIQTEDITYPPIEGMVGKERTHCFVGIQPLYSHNGRICDALWLHLSKDAAGIL